MKTLAIGEVRQTLNAIVRDREPTIIRVGRFARAVVLPLPPEATVTEYEVVLAELVGFDPPPGDGCLWLMRPVK